MSTSDPYGLADRFVAVLWFIAWRVLDDALIACCYVCDWRSEPAADQAMATAWLNTHLRTEEHLSKV